MEELKKENEDLRRSVKTLRILFITTAVSVAIMSVGNARAHKNMNKEFKNFVETEASIDNLIIQKNHLQDEYLQALIEGRKKYLSN